MQAAFDLIIATDLRFPGGSSSSTLEEVLVNHANGWRTGLVHIPSKVIKMKRPFHRGLVTAMLEGKCELITDLSGHVETKLLAFRHPAVLHSSDRLLPNIAAERVILIVNHPPSNAEGRIDYILPYAQDRISASYGVRAETFPIGPLIRDSIRKYYGNSVSLEDDDWSNVFDTRRFHCTRRHPRNIIRIGRHSRPGPEKWPTDASAILSAYPTSNEIDVFILGGSEAPEKVLGTRPKNWTVYEFGSMPAEKFLANLDIFVYFHHPDWVEAFGRVIAEAMAAGLPTILPAHFRPLFGEGALYAEPENVGDMIHALRDPTFYREKSTMARNYVEAQFSHRRHVDRMRKFGVTLEQAA